MSMSFSEDAPHSTHGPRRNRLTVRERTSLLLLTLASAMMIGCSGGATDDASSSVARTTPAPPSGAESAADASSTVPSTMREPTSPMNGGPFDSSALVVMEGASSPGSTPEAPDILVWEWDDGACPLQDTCGSNTPPVLGEPLFLINGVVNPELSDVRNGDEVQLLVAVEDAECNLACGSYISSYESQQGSQVGSASLPSNVPCSTHETNIYLPLGVGIPTITSSDPNAFLGRVDSYVFAGRVSDVCGASSGSITVSFDVHFD